MPYNTVMVLSLITSIPHNDLFKLGRLTDFQSPRVLQHMSTFQQSSKSTNPFDVNSEPPPVQAPTV